MTKEEKEVWDFFRKRKKECQEELAELRQLLIDKPDYEYRKPVEEDIDYAETALNAIRRLIPE